MSNNDKQNLDIVHNEQAKRFETSIDGHMGYISYQERGDQLVKHALNYAQDNNKKVVPQCSFVASYIDKHPEYKGLL